MNRNNNDLYRMYEAEYNKNKKLKQENVNYIVNISTNY